MSGSKWLINGRYHRSGVGIAADAVAAVKRLEKVVKELTKALEKSSRKRKSKAGKSKSK